MRQAFAVLIGLIFGGVFIAGGEALIHSLFSLEVPSENATQQELFDYVQQISVFAKICLLINGALSVFIASLVASFVQGRTTIKTSIIVAGILQLLQYMNMLLIPGHPTWVVVTTTIMCLPIGALAYFLVRKKQKQLENSKKESGI